MNDDYRDSLDITIDVLKEYIRRKDGIEYNYQRDKDRYWDFLTADKRFHVYAFFKYGLIIKYDDNTEELDIKELKGFREGKYNKEALATIKAGIDRFGSIEECQKAYNEFKEQHPNLKDIGEINKAFEKESGIPTRMAIPGYLNKLIDSD
jgi:hypothetical protein